MGRTSSLRVALVATLAVCLVAATVSVNALHSERHLRQKNRAAGAVKAVAKQAGAAAAGGAPAGAGSGAPNPNAGGAPKPPQAAPGQPGAADAGQTKGPRKTALPAAAKPFNAESDIPNWKTCPLSPDKLKQQNLNDGQQTTISMKKASVETQEAFNNGQLTEGAGGAADPNAAAGGAGGEAGVAPMFLAEETVFEVRRRLHLGKKNKKNKRSAGGAPGAPGAGSAPGLAVASLATEISHAASEAAGGDDACMACQDAWDFVVASTEQTKPLEARQWLKEWHGKAAPNRQQATLAIIKALSTVEKGPEKWKIGRVVAGINEVPNGFEDEAKAYFCKFMSCCDDSAPELKSPDMETVSKAVQTCITGACDSYKEFADYEDETPGPPQPGAAGAVAAAGGPGSAPAAAGGAPPPPAPAGL